MKEKYIKYLPLDFVEYYNLVDSGDYQRLSTGYITGINIYGDIKVYDPASKELNIRAHVTKLLKRQIPFGNKSICNECSFGKYMPEGCSICDYRYKIITPGQKVFIDGLLSCEVREFFITHQNSTHAVALSIPKPLDNSLKDGSVEGLNYILEHQLDHKLHEYLMYTVWSRDTGNMTFEYNVLNKITPEINLYPEIFIHETPCEYCILNDSDICKQCYFYNYYDKKTY